MRITIKMINQKIVILNQITKSAEKPYSERDGKVVSHIGNYHSYSAYGAIGVHRMSSAGGTEEVIGLGTKRETYYRLCSFIDGIYARRDAATERWVRATKKSQLEQSNQ